MTNTFFGRVPGNSALPLELNPDGYKIGQRAFQSFLLAGERYLTHNMARENTAEAYFGSFFRRLSTPVQEKMQGYFQRQTSMDAKQRARILGPLAAFQTSQPLTTTETAADFLGKPGVRAALTDAMKQFGQQPEKQKLADSVDTLRLYLDRIVVRYDNFHEAIGNSMWNPDATAFWFDFYNTNVTFTVRFGVIYVDESGDAKWAIRELGKVSEDEPKRYKPEGYKLCGFSILEGGEYYPKFYTAYVFPIAHAVGDNSDVIKSATDYVQLFINEQKRIAGITEDKWNMPLPFSTAQLISNAVRGYLDALVEWMTNLEPKEDACLGMMTQAIFLLDDAPLWVSTGTPKTAPYVHEFRTHFPAEDGNTFWQIETTWVRLNKMD